MWNYIYLNIAQAFLQVGNHFRELGPILNWRKMIIMFSASVLNSQTHQIRTRVSSLKRRPVC